jgi:hypothetical protein
MPARKRRALDEELNEYIPFGIVPSLDVTGALVDRDGDRTPAHVSVRIREKPIKGYEPSNDTAHRHQTGHQTEDDSAQPRLPCCASLTLGRAEAADQQGFPSRRSRVRPPSSA